MGGGGLNPILKGGDGRLEAYETRVVSDIRGQELKHRNLLNELPRADKRVIFYPYCYLYDGSQCKGTIP